MFRRAIQSSGSLTQRFTNAALFSRIPASSPAVAVGLSTRDAHVQIRHNNKRVEVTGDTFEVKDVLKRARLRWDGMTASWWTEDQRAVDGLVSQLEESGVEVSDERSVTKPIPVVRISTDPATSNVVATGSTFLIREELKAAGFRWAPDSKAWVATDRASKSAIMTAAQIHGLGVEDETTEAFPSSSPPSPSGSSSLPSSSSGTERFPPQQPGVFQRSDKYRTLTLTQSDKGLYLRGEACRTLLVYLKAHGWQFHPFEQAWFKDIASVEQTIESLRQEASHKKLSLSVAPSNS